MYVLFCLFDWYCFWYTLPLGHTEFMEVHHCIALSCRIVFLSSHFTMTNHQSNHSPYAMLFSVNMLAMSLAMLSALYAVWAEVTRSHRLSSHSSASMLRDDLTRDPGLLYIKLNKKVIIQSWIHECCQTVALWQDCCISGDNTRFGTNNQSGFHFS